MAAAFGLVVGVVVFLLLRWYKKRHPAAAAAGPHKADCASDTSSQRNRVSTEVDICHVFSFSQQ
jgi:hypothetical protein